MWRALTDPALVAKWWAAGDVRAEVGHRFDMDMGRGVCSRAKCSPWSRGDCCANRFAQPTLDTIITFELTPEGSGTKLTLTHEGFDLDKPMARRAFEGMRPGWPGILAKIDAVA